MRRALGTAAVVIAAALLLSAYVLPSRPPERGPHRVTLTATGARPGSSLEGIGTSPVVLAATWYRWASLQPPPPPPEPPRARARSSAPATSSRPPASSVDWDGIATCETGGDWTMTGPRFSGGLGFANTTWDGFGGREFADLAGHATREQQITVAERVYARFGLSGWGCRAYG